MFIGKVFTSDGRWNEEAHAWLLKLTQFCMSFIALWSQNGRFQLSNFVLVFVLILTYHPESWIMTEIILSLGQASDMRFFEESSMV